MIRFEISKYIKWLICFEYIWWQIAYSQTHQMMHANFLPKQRHFMNICLLICSSRKYSHPNKVEDIQRVSFTHTHIVSSAKFLNEAHHAVFVRRKQWPSPTCLAPANRSSASVGCGVHKYTYTWWWRQNNVAYMCSVYSAQRWQNCTVCFHYEYIRNDDDYSYYYSNTYFHLNASVMHVFHMYM